MTNRTAKCMCGAVTLRLQGAEDTFSACYCDACQRWGGGPFRGVSVKTENLGVDGEAHVGIVQSSSFAERAFCTKCGSGLWYRLTAGQYVGSTSVPIGLLDDRSGLTLSYEMFSDYKDSSNRVPENTRQMTSAEAEEIIATFDTGPVI